MTGTLGNACRLLHPQDVSCAEMIILKPSPLSLLPFSLCAVAFAGAFAFAVAFAMAFASALHLPFPLPLS